MIRRTLAFVVVLLAGLDARAQNADEWLADYQQLREHMNGVYANLEWIVEHRGLDLVELDQSTVQRIQDGGGGGAIEDFVEAFDDPHFRIQKPPGWFRRLIGRFQSDSSHEEFQLPADSSPSSACDALGYSNRNMSFRLPFDSLSNYQRLESDLFPAATFEDDHGRRVAIIRIAHLGEDGYRSVAEEVWPRFAEKLKAPLDDSGRWDFQRAVGAELVRRFSDVLRQLQKSSPELLLVDLTGNGGGSELDGSLVRTLTDKPLRCGRDSFVRHPHWVEILDWYAERLEAQRATLEPDAWEHELLDRAEGRLRAARAEAQRPCDRSGLWRGEEPPCEQLVSSPLTSCGLLEYVEPGGLGRLSPMGLFSPALRPYEEGVWSGPLAVLVDEHTASAAEGFTSTLQENQVALVVGGTTVGAGCGYVAGGVPVTLEHSRWLVRMPDCVRYRADGANEIEGIEPDRLIWTTEDSKDKRLTALRELLPEL